MEDDCGGGGPFLSSLLLCVEREQCRNNARLVEAAEEEEADEGLQPEDGLRRWSCAVVVGGDGVVGIYAS